MLAFECFGVQGGEDSGLYWGVFGVLRGGLRELFGLWLVTGRDISAMSCQAFEDCLEDGAAEYDHVLRVRGIGCGFVFWCRSYFGSWGRRLVGLWLRIVLVLFFLRVGESEIGAGDLERVEEEAGATGIDVIGGDTSEDRAESVLDLCAAAGCWKKESVAPGLPLLRVSDGFVSGVMVVAKFFSAQGRTAATVPVRFGMAAEVVLCVAGIFDLLNHLYCVFHDGLTPLDFVQSLRNRRDEGGLPSSVLPVRG